VEVEDRIEKRQRLRRLLECLPKESCFREDLVLYFKRMIVSEFSLLFNFKKVLLGTNSHKVAVQLFSQIAKGRGVSASHEISFIDDKNFGGRVAFMNPMRDFLKKEIALYNHNRGVFIIP
jgi:tRNA(Ile)-lysidine synthase TilS/MesJ